MQISTHNAASTRRTSGPAYRAVSIKGRVLIAEDEPLIALDLACEFEKAGAEVIVVHTLQNAIAIARIDALSAAVVDLRLKNDLSSPLCALLQLRDIPFVVYTGYSDIDCRYSRLIISKPAPVHLIIERLAVMTLNRPDRSNGNVLASHALHR